LRHSRISDNTGTGIDNLSQDLLVQDSVIADNCGNGIADGIQKHASVRSSTIRGNAGAGIVLGGSAEVYDSVLRDNLAGGITSRDFLFTCGSQVIGNSSPADGGGIFVRSTT
jgi:hypothetical protein